MLRISGGRSRKVRPGAADGESTTVGCGIALLLVMSRVVSVLPEAGEGADDGHPVATVLVGGRAMLLTVRRVLRDEEVGGFD